MFVFLIYSTIFFFDSMQARRARVCVCVCVDWICKELYGILLNTVRHAHIFISADSVGENRGNGAAHAMRTAQAGLFSH